VAEDSFGCKEIRKVLVLLRNLHEKHRLCT